ncbi:MAG: LysR family transcriptional regulator [Rhizobiales bacterium]|nr:LysR family transcriptional regulator [Hyphomicrobiales bacterium]
MLDPLTLDQLRVLVTVTEEGSFSAAARKLGRVQSAISQAVQSLETALGVQLFDREGKIPQLNDAGRVLLTDARRLIGGAEALKAKAESFSEGVEPELTLAVDAMFPSAVLTRSLRALSEVYPCLQVTVFTEAMGGAEQRLRDGAARLAFCVPIPGVGDNRESEFLVTIPMVPVVATSHPLAQIDGPILRADLESAVQLVLTDRTPVSNGLTGGIISARTWRFADLATRLEFLLGAFGWCNMPYHLVRDHVEEGRLKVLDVTEPTVSGLDIHVVHERGRAPGKAGRWLIEDLRKHVTECTGHGLLGDQPAAPVKMARPPLALIAASTGTDGVIHQPN